MYTVTQILEDARSRITDPARWTQFEFARDVAGYGCISGDSPEAVCWCARGSMRKSLVDLRATHETYSAAIHELERFSKLLYGTNISCANDEYGHAATIKMFDEAIAHSKRAEA